MDVQKLNAAVRECLDECYNTAQPLEAVTLHATRLRQDPNWTEEEVQEFEDVVLRILAAILTD